MRRLIPALSFALGCTGAREYPEVREPCADHSELRNVYWGDLHVHTRNSFDAWVYDVRATPEDAYAFARGEPIEVPANAAEGGVGRSLVQLDRPLDFAAVTDHAEFLGEVTGCTTEGSSVYASEVCVRYREATAGSIQSFGVRLATPEPSRFPELCEGDYDCLGTAGDVWSRIRTAAEAAYDRSEACAFTSFVGYEWTGATLASNYHRNVIFRTSEVPALPTSYFEAPTAVELWRTLDAECLEEPDCDVLAIPHNSNMANGQMFKVEGGSEEATLRAELEPLLEIYQHKGDSECTNGLSGVLGAEDEACDFEKLRFQPLEDCGDVPGSGAMANLGCVSQLDFARGILLEGLRETERVGVNPYRLGFIASTDTHSGTPGAVDEAAYRGQLGNHEDDPRERLVYPELNPGGVVDSGGGLAAVWAEENTRNAIFDALERRETYGTSGPRITVRFFGGDLDEGLCDAPDLVEQGYRDGSPMGGVLTELREAPRFVVQAARDPGTSERPGGKLERLQIVKGWVDADGQRHTQVVDVAGETAGSVDLQTCEPDGVGADILCGEWLDPEFDPSLRAWYYARVLEAPSCRWSQRDCLSLPEGERPEPCADERIPQTLRERAWTSPIWVE